MKIILTILAITVIYQLNGQVTCNDCDEIPWLEKSLECEISYGNSGPCPIHIFYKLRKIDTTGPCSSLTFKNEILINRIEILWEANYDSCNAYFKAYSNENSLINDKIYKEALKCVLSDAYPNFNNNGTIHHYFIKVFSPHCWDRYLLGDNKPAFWSCVGNPDCCNWLYTISDHKQLGDNVKVNNKSLVLPQPNNCPYEPLIDLTCIYICNESVDINTQLGVKKPIDFDNPDYPLFDFMMFPNPSNGFIKFEYGAEGCGHITLSIYNQIGRRIYKGGFAGAPGKFSGEVDLSGNSAGVYFYRAEDSDGKSYSGSFIIIR